MQPTRGVRPTSDVSQNRNKGKEKVRGEEQGNSNGRVYQNETHYQRPSIQVTSGAGSSKTQSQVSSSKVWTVAKFASKPKTSPLSTPKPQVKATKGKKKVVEQEQDPTPITYPMASLPGLAVETQAHSFSFIERIKDLFTLRGVCKIFQPTVEELIIDRALEYGFVPLIQTAEISQQRVKIQFNPVRGYLINLFKRISTFILTTSGNKSITTCHLDKNNKLVKDSYQSKKINETFLKRLPECSLDYHIFIFSKVAAQKSDAISRGLLAYLFKRVSMGNLTQIQSQMQEQKSPQPSAQVQTKIANNRLDTLKRLINNSIKNNHLEIVKFLFSNADQLDEAFSLNKIFLTAIQGVSLKGMFKSAVQHGHMEIIDFFLQRIEENSQQNQTPVGKPSNKLTVEDFSEALQVAVRHQLHQPELIQMLVTKGAQVSVTDGSGNTLLHFFEYQNWNASIEKSVEILLTEQPDLLYVCNRSGATTLMFACSKLGNIEAIKYLLKKQVDPNKQTNQGYTALHAVLKQLELPKCPPIEIIKLLLENRANPDLCDNQRGLTAYDYVILEDNIAVLQFLLKYGVDPNRFILDAILWQKAEAFSYLIEDQRADINKVDCNGFSPLGLAEYVQKLRKTLKIEIIGITEIIELLKFRKAEKIKPSKQKIAEIQVNLKNRLMLGE